MDSSLSNLKDLNFADGKTERNSAIIELFWDDKWNSPWGECGVLIPKLDCTMESLGGSLRNTDVWVPHLSLLFNWFKLIAEHPEILDIP